MRLFALHPSSRRQKADAGHSRSQDETSKPVSAPGEVQAADERHREEEKKAGRSDADLERRVDAQRMAVRRNHARREKAPEAHAPHERSKEHAERDRRRADDQLEGLEPDDLVDQRGRAAPNEQQQNGGGNHSQPERLKPIKSKEQRTTINPRAKG